MSWIFQVTSDFKYFVCCQMMCMDFSLENVVTEFIDQLWNSNGLWHYVVILFLGHDYKTKPNQSSLRLPNNKLPKQ